MRRAVVVLLTLTVSAATLALSAPPGYAGCSQAQRTAGVCVDIDIGDDEVRVERSESTPGAPGTPGTSQTTSSSTWEPPPLRMEAELGSAECEIKIDGLCRGAAPPKPTTTESAATPPTPPRYASELEGFRPDRPGITVEPAGWSMPRLPTNFVARADTHREQGELLDWPVEVRFRPVTYHWQYGDGGGRSVTTRGSDWSSQGKRQFDTTATSYVYRAPGTYTVSLHVDYAVDIRFENDEFEELEGTVSVAAPSVEIDVLTVSPLVVDGN